MKDFIFGTLATQELRFEHVRTHRAGVSHSQRREPRDPLPGQEVRLELSVGPGFPCEQAWVYWTNDGSDPKGSRGVASKGHVSLMQAGVVEWDTVLWGYMRHFHSTIPGQAAGSVVRYCLGASDLKGEEILADQGALYAYYVEDDPTPTWSKDAIIYQIFVDRFNPGLGQDWNSPEAPAGFYGGTIRGISEKLDYLSELGVNILWLTPIFPSPSHHGYDATDLFEVEPRLGTKSDLRVLLEEAHQRGVRILLDLAPNHVSSLHPAFQSAISNINSPYVKWFTFSHWPEKYQSFFDVPELPQLNLRELGARRYVLDAAAYWLEFGVDGYRVDYALGPTPDFWADFRRVTRQARPDCWTFGEVVEPPESQITFEGGLDGCLDFNLLEAFRNAFAYGDWSASQFASYLVRHEAFFPNSFSRPSFLDNHDMNRFLWAADGDKRRLRLAAMCQLSLSGAPVIYYGTDVGLSQLRDVRQGELGLPEESRLPMLWGEAQDTGLKAYYRSLINLRKATPGFRHAKVRILQADDDVLVYTKENDEKVFVMLNLSLEPRMIDIHQKVKALIKTGESDVELGKYGINLSPLSGAVISVE
jgi:cyclomaltodextrinase